jgi:hypothetical protein
MRLVVVVAKGKFDWPWIFRVRRRPTADAVGDKDHRECAMLFSNVRTYEDLERFLREFVNFGEDVGQYDFNGALYLLRALLENLATNCCDGDDEVLGYFREELKPEHKQFLKKLMVE